MTSCHVLPSKTGLQILERRMCPSSQSIQMCHICLTQTGTSLQLPLSPDLQIVFTAFTGEGGGGLINHEQLIPNKAAPAPTPTESPHRWVLAAIDWAMALLSMSRSRALDAQPTTAGGKLLEKR